MNINITMARNTNRNNIKPMLFFVTVAMMVLLGLFGTVMALQGINSWQFASLRSGAHSTFCLLSIGISSVITFMSFNLNNSTFFALFILFLVGFEMFTFLLISFLGSLPFCCLFVLFAILQPTEFALISIAVLINVLLVKFRKWFDILAFGTSFRYDFVRHLLLLIRSKCLESIAVYTIAVDSSYYMADWGDVK